MSDARWTLWEETCRCGGADTADPRMCRCPASDHLQCDCGRGVLLPKSGPRGNFWGCSMYKKTGCKLTKPWGVSDASSRLALEEHEKEKAREAAHQALIRDPYEKEWQKTCRCGGVEDLNTFACHRNYKTCVCPSCPQCGAELFLNFAKGGGDRRWWGCSAWKQSGCSFKASYIPHATATAAARMQAQPPSMVPPSMAPAAALVQPPPPAAAAFAATESTFLSCPFAEKDQAKALGAKFDWNRKQWYVPAGMDLQPFGRWLQSRPWERRDAPAIAPPAQAAAAPAQAGAVPAAA